MAGVIVQFDNGNLPYESYQHVTRLATAAGATLDCVESNTNGLFLHFAGLADEPDGHDLGMLCLSTSLFVKGFEASPCL